MKSLLESLLDDIEDIQTKINPELKLKSFIDWLNKYKEDGFKANNYVELNKDGLIDVNSTSIRLTKDVKPMPAGIDIGTIDRLYILSQDPLKWFPKPNLIKDLVIEGDLDNQEFNVLDCLVRKSSNVKKLKLNIPETKPGLQLNIFTLDFFHLKHVKDFEEIKINGIQNIIVNLDGADVVKPMIKQIQKEYKKWIEDNPNYHPNDSYEFIINIVKQHIPLDYIDKHWKGITRIVFKDKAGMLRHSLISRDERGLYSGDFYIQKNHNGEWLPCHKLIKKIKK